MCGGVGGVGEVDGTGRLVRIPRTTYNFSGAASSVQDVPLTDPFWTHTWASCVLSVRLHAKSSFPTSSTAQVVVQNALRVDDEPNVIYAADLGNVTVATADAAPKLYTLGFSSDIGPMLRLLLRWNQGSTSAVNFALSIDLLGRP